MQEFTDDVLRIADPTAWYKKHKNDPKPVLPIRISLDILKGDAYTGVFPPEGVSYVELLPYSDRHITFEGFREKIKVLKHLEDFHPFGIYASMMKDKSGYPVRYWKDGSELIKVHIDISSPNSPVPEFRHYEWARDGYVPAGTDKFIGVKHGTRVVIETVVDMSGLIDLVKKITGSHCAYGEHFYKFRAAVVNRLAEEASR